MKPKLLIAIVVVGLALVGGIAAVTACNSQSCIFLPNVVQSSTPTARPGPLPTATLNPDPEFITGLAILGDSTQDEYRTDNPRGEQYNATTLNWVEQLAELRDVNLGPLGSYPEPRRSGYAYNWSRSGATAGQMIYTEQHLGAAKQIADGEVSHVIIQIGINDFDADGFGKKIYAGLISGDELKSKLNYISDLIIQAAHTVKQAGECQVIVAAMQDYMTLPVVPELYGSFQDQAGRQRFIDAVAYLNNRLRAASEQEGYIFFDFNAAYLAEIQSRMDAGGFLVVGSERIDLTKRGNEPHYGLLDDGYIHPGTVLSSLYTNVYIRAMNEHFQTAIMPLSDDEILRTAGIKP